MFKIADRLDGGDLSSIASRCHSFSRALRRIFGWVLTRLSFVESPGGVGLCLHMIDLLVFCSFGSIDLRDRTTAAHAAPLREAQH